jgi:hypothetical protein
MICICRKVAFHANEIEKASFELLLSLVHESVGNDKLDEILFGINEIMFDVYI